MNYSDMKHESSSNAESLHKTQTQTKFNNCLEITVITRWRKKKVGTIVIYRGESYEC